MESFDRTSSWDAKIISDRSRILRRLVSVVIMSALLGGCSPEARKARSTARGEEYFKAGDYEKAKIEYMKLLLLDPRNDLPFRRLGFIWEQEGALLRAAPFLLKARELAPNDITNRLTLARTFISLSRTEEARKEVLAVLEQDPQQEEAVVLLADTDQTKEDLDYTDQYLRKLPTSDYLSVQLASANVAVQRADFKSAATSLERAAALDSKSPLPHLALAKLDLYQKKLSEAEQEFKTAVELAPIRSGARLKYAEFKMRNGAGNDVKDLLLDTVRRAPDYLPAWCFLSQIALSSRQYDEAAKVLENVFSRDPQNPEARILEAEILLAKGDTKKAVERFEELDKTYKDVPFVNYQLACAYLQNNNPGQATVALTHAIAAKPDYLEAILLRSQLDLQSGNASLAVASMTNILKQRPHLRQAELILTEAYLSLRQFEDAAAVIKDHVRVSPDDADAYYQLGLVLREGKKLDEAKAAFAKVVELLPDNLKAINQLVDLDIARHDFNSAMLRVQRELQKQPQSPIACFMEGKIHAAQGRLDLAEASLNRALELDRNSLGTYQLLISTYLSDNKPDQAIKLLQDLLSQDPHQNWALATLASTYAKTGDLAHSRDTYERLLSETPDSADVMTKLAVLYADRFNQIGKAYDLANKARSLFPIDPFVADTLGWICYKQGNYQQALALVREAADKLPANSEVQFHLGMANYMMDQPDAARVALKKAVADKTEFPQKDEAVRWLAFLEDDSGAAKQFSVNELEALVELRPKDVVARSRLAALYRRQGDAKKAAAQYESALSINPNLANAALELAQLYSGPLHNLTKALEMAKIARELDKSDPQTGRVLGKIAYQAGNFSWAYDLLSQANHHRKEDAEIAYDLAWAAYSLGKVLEAQQTMRRALDLGLHSPQRDDARRFLDLVALEQNNKRSVGSDVEIKNSLTTDPHYVPALMVKAAILMERGDTAAATEAYNLVLQRFPDFAPAEKVLARLYLATSGTFDKAYDLAVKARSSLPDDAEVAQTLGELSYQRNEYEYALQLLEETAKAKPLDAKGLYYLGMCQYHMQQKTQSQNALERSLQTGLPEPLATDAKRVLAGMQNGN